MDIFRGWVWYAYKENPVNWHKLTVEQTNQIILLNKDNKKATSLEEYASELEFEVIETSNFADGVGQDSLTRFDKPKFKKKKKRSNNNRNRNFKGNRKNLQKKNN